MVLFLTASGIGKFKLVASTMLILHENHKKRSSSVFMLSKFKSLFDFAFMCIDISGCCVAKKPRFALRQ